MTAIVQNRDFTAPAVARAGLVLPGLGHVLLGEWVAGVGLLAMDVTLAWAGLSLLGGVGDVLYGVDHATSHIAAQLSWHGMLALACWPVLVAMVWWIAFRRAFPRALNEEQFNSNRQVFLRQFARNRTGMLGLVGAAVICTFVLLTPMIAPFDPDKIDAGPKNLAPSLIYLMGTDEFGRDLFSRVLYGGRISMSIGFVAVAIAATIGTAVGAVAGFAGGWLDRALMWFVDLLLALPRLVLLLAIAGMFRVTGPEGLFLMVTILGLTGWMSVSRIVRSQVLSLKQQDFVQAARALGFSPLRIVFRHLVPNALAPVIVYCSLAVGATMITEAGLSFLGLGVPPPTSTWGTIINDGRAPLRIAPWIATFPGLCIVFSVMAFNLLGDGLRDALDPKLRGSR